jgi:hypothetical protein
MHHATIVAPLAALLVAAVAAAGALALPPSAGASARAQTTTRLPAWAQLIYTVAGRRHTVTSYPRT